MENLDWLSGVVFPYINFFIFLFVLIKVAKAPLLGILAKRKEDYEAIYKKANQEKKDAEVKLAELNSRMTQLSKEVEEVQSKARDEAKKEAKGIIEEGKRLAENIKLEARRIAEVEAQKAQESLERMILDQVYENVLKKLKNDLVETDHEQINAKQIERLKTIEL